MVCCDQQGGRWLVVKLDDHRPGGMTGQMQQPHQTLPTYGGGSRSQIIVEAASEPHPIA